MELKQKKVIITGATSGVGLELAKLLSKDNQVIVLGRNQTKLDELVRDLKLQAYQVDLSQLHEVEKICNKISNDHNEIDILINNAGVQYLPTFLEEDFSLSLAYQFEKTQMTKDRSGEKMTAIKAASEILEGLKRERPRLYIGKVKILASLMKVVPSVARNIMKKW